MSAPVLYLPQAGSTNAWAKAHPNYAPGVWAVYTTDQTAGRGRLGRAWAGAAGQALYYTVVFPFAPRQLGTLPLLASLLVCQALRGYYPLQPADLQIKWPNDVLLQGKKLAGILCESAGADKTLCGIGINLAQSPSFFEGAGLPHATSLAARGVPANAVQDAPALARALTEAFAAEAPRLWQTGFAPYRAEYARQCVNPGRRVTWEGGAGVALDVDDEGRLLVQEEGTGVVRLFTGEVSVQGIYGSV